jgi:hypothetical protein
MKLSTLLEMPELKNEPLDHVDKDERADYMSYHAVERLYDILDSDDRYMKVDNKIVIPMLGKKKLMAAAFIRSYNPHSQDYNALRFITKLFFYHPGTLSKVPNDIKNPLQVQLVYTATEFEHNGIASYLYATIIKNGYTIVSDEVQYLGGYKLWKKMANQAKLYDYKIRIWNKDNGYLKDDNDQIIEYDSTNIDDSLIWKENTIGRKTLIILSQT